MNRGSIIGIGILACLLVTLAGCSSNVNDIKNDNSEVEIKEDHQVERLENIVKDSSVIAVRRSNHLLLVNPENKEFVDLYQLQGDEVPLSNELFDFKVSPGHKWIVWYSSRKGLITYDIENKKVEVIANVNDWFNRNPYFELDDEKEIVYWIGNDGAVLNELNLETKDLSTIMIPYPFGNIFKVSPNNERFLYITGFSNQNSQSQRPRFMFSDRQGTLDSTFASQVELSSRFTVEWSPDNQGILTIFDDQVWFYPYSNPDNPTIFVQFEGGVGARDIKKLGEEIFVLDSGGYWHRYEYSTKKETARIPTDIAKELRKPIFYPWADQMFLISETSQDEENKFQRLWLSNYRGQKEIVLSHFGEAQVTTFNEQLD